MSRREKLFASGLILLLFLGAVLPAATRVQYWPFLYYKMYSRIERMEDGLGLMELHGVPYDRSVPERPLVDRDETHPFAPPRLLMALNRASVRDRQEPGHLAEVVQFILVNYERRRSAGLHTGPKLAGLKLYRVRWTLDPWARNAKTPDEKRLVLHAVADWQE